MIRLRLGATALLTLLLPFTVSAQDSDDPYAADHEQLRALRASLVEAFNAGDLDVLEEYLYPTFAATMVDQDLLTSRADFDQYLEKWFGGDDPFVRQLTMNPVPDTLTQIFDDRFGIVYGTNSETYELGDGSTHVLNSRWTATVIKEDGDWKLLSIHNGVDFLDNPVLAIARRTGWMMGGGGVLVGLLIGAVAGWSVRGRRHSAGAA